MTFWMSISRRSPSRISSAVRLRRVSSFWNSSSEMFFFALPYAVSSSARRHFELQPGGLREEDVLDDELVEQVQLRRQRLLVRQDSATGPTCAGMPFDVVTRNRRGRRRPPRCRPRLLRRLGRRRRCGTPPMRTTARDAGNEQRRSRSVEEHVYRSSHCGEHRLNQPTWWTMRTTVSARAPRTVSR